MKSVKLGNINNNRKKVREMKILRFAAVVLAALMPLMPLYGGEPSKPSEVAPLPKELAGADAIPQFIAWDSLGDDMFQRRDLMELAGRTPGVKRVALNYFATWCAECAAGGVKLKNARTALNANGVLTVLVNVGEGDGEVDTDSVHRFVRKWFGYGFPMIMDMKRRMAGPYGLTEPNGMINLPKTLVLDAKLKPLFLLKTEGSDFPEILWKYNP